MIIMKKLLSIILLFTIIFSLCSCTPQEAHDSLEAMDTFMDFSIYGGTSEWAMKGVKNEILELDKALSTTDTGDIGLLNKYGEHRISDVAREPLTRSLELCKELDGALDITVYPLVEEWGFISGDYKVPSKSRINELLKYVDYNKVKVDEQGATLPKGTKVDLGAVAKGYAADRCRELIKEEGSKAAILNLGGTIATYGTKPDGSMWKVGITDPDDTSTYFGYLSCRDTVVSTSGGYERSFKGKDGKTYIHIIDPKTGYPVDNGTKSVSVISEDGIRADALSTALYVMGADKAVEYTRSHDGFDVIILTDDNKLYISGDIADSFTLKKDYEIIKV